MRAVLQNRHPLVARRVEVEDLDNDERDKVGALPSAEEPVELGLGLVARDQVRKARGYEAPERLTCPKYPSEKFVYEKNSLFIGMPAA